MHPLGRSPLRHHLTRACVGLGLACLLCLAPTWALDINEATEAQLDSVRGLGPASTARILEARQAGGPFKDWADLMQRVKGIKAATARKLSDAGLTVGEQPFAPPASAPKP
ncbi:helix-hairpin-helix domain-containing protein [Curvibacter sp. CHRR-16]|uniref:ComEA family DNA-binding protein n=1 Tax=Curvibacter sp. CHRR-16 TaxID=2835872 RepID=UPI001BD98786|nr:helix-hairpin-helix domain-containing protein [Curvibacter sp. CHRR-16]MBT0570777.1 helix-hairpin-helix domain-containing protein [Curvibacter sp. CHRR-16]